MASTWKTIPILGDRLIVTPLVHLPLLGVGSKLTETVDKLKLLSKKPRQTIGSSWTGDDAKVVAGEFGAHGDGVGPYEPRPGRVA